MARTHGRSAGCKQATPARQRMGAEAQLRLSAALAALRIQVMAVMARTVAAATEAAAGMEVVVGVGTGIPNQATAGMAAAARGALAAAVRGVQGEPARGDQEAGVLGARAALAEQGQGVLGQTQATTHDAICAR